MSNQKINELHGNFNFTKCFTELFEFPNSTVKHFCKRQKISSQFQTLFLTKVFKLKNKVSYLTCTSNTV